MVKRLVFGGAVAGALATAFLLGSLMLGGAFAETPTPPSQTPAQPQAQPQPQAEPTEQAGTQQEEQQPQLNGSVTAPQDQNGQSEQDEGTALAAMAKITADQAKAAAVAAIPGGAAGKVELENENGSVVYSVHVTANGKSSDVKVDAGNGKVLATDADDHNGAEGGKEGAGETAGAED